MARNSCLNNSNDDRHGINGSRSFTNGEFLNASKREVNIDGKTATRNKVGFFKRSLVIVRD